MKKFFSLLFIAISAVGISAQQLQNSEPEIKPCGNFKMPIIVPPGNFDYSFVVEPVSDQNSKIVSIDPCGKTKNKLMENDLTQSIPNKSLLNLFAPKKQ